MGLTTSPKDMVDRPGRLLVFTGSGLSADSGIATFRGSDGTWENHDVNVVANGYTWKSNFETVRSFYNARRAGLAGVEPNAAHLMLADWQRRYGATILTQNIDDLLERAGCSDVVHLHGKLTEMRCEACGKTWDIGYREWGQDERCVCGSRRGVRPNVVFFNEQAPRYAAMYRAFREIGGPRDCIVVIGTSGQVINIDSFIFDNRALTVLNNLESSRYINEEFYDHVLLGKAAEQCARIDGLVSSHLSGDHT